MAEEDTQDLRPGPGGGGDRGASAAEAVFPVSFSDVSEAERNAVDTGPLLRRPTLRSGSVFPRTWVGTDHPPTFL